MFFMEEFLNVKEGLAFVDGDKDLYKILLDAYLEENKISLEDLTSLIKKKDFEGSAKTIHRTKGASYQIGAKKIGDKAQYLEDLFRGKTTPGAKDKSEEELLGLVTDFFSDYEKCLSEAEAAIKGL